MICDNSTEELLEQTAFQLMELYQLCRVKAEYTYISPVNNTKHVGQQAI